LCHWGAERLVSKALKEAHSEAGNVGVKYIGVNQDTKEGELKVVRTGLKESDPKRMETGKGLDKKLRDQYTTLQDLLKSKHLGNNDKKEIYNSLKEIETRLEKNKYASKAKIPFIKLLSWQERSSISLLLREPFADMRSRAVIDKANATLVDLKGKKVKAHYTRMGLGDFENSQIDKNDISTYLELRKQIKENYKSLDIDALNAKKSELEQTLKRHSNPENTRTNTENKERKTQLDISIDVVGKLLEKKQKERSKQAFEKRPSRKQGV